MLKVRIIPTLLWKNFSLVKGVSFESWRSVGSVLPAIKVYNSRDVDELFLFDICGNQGLSDPDFDSIEEFSKHCFVPFTVGGGIRNTHQIQGLLQVGADKISLNTAIFETPKLLEEASKKFGSQCIVASIDFKLVDNEYLCFSHSGTKCTSRDPIELSRELENRGAGEILITSIDRDGTMKGYDIDILNAISSSVNIPVIASGGAGIYEHMWEAIDYGGVSAVAAASMFHFTEQTPQEAKEYLSKRGIAVRLAYKDQVDANLNSLA
tara:strand:+ start:397 stop:1194 length:798 start_codon:yes stop_codon:yes gene_type:complete